MFGVRKLKTVDLNEFEIRNVSSLGPLLQVPGHLVNCGRLSSPGQSRYVHATVKWSRCVGVVNGCGLPSGPLAYLAFHKRADTCKFPFTTRNSVRDRGDM